MGNKNARIAATMRATQVRRQSQSCRVFQLKIQSNSLNQQQQVALKMLFVEAKWLYNHALSQGITKYVPGKTVEVRNKEGKFETRDLTVIGSQMKQSVLANMHSSLRGLASHKKAGRRVGSLKYISQYTSVDLKQYGTTYRINKNRVRIQNIPGWVKTRGLHQLEGWELANAKLMKKPDGYYLHVTAFKNKNDIPNTFIPGTKIGLDMGLTTHITLSDGTKISATVGETDRLKRLQKKLSKQIKGSNNYLRTRTLLQREQQKNTNRRNDKANKVVHDILLNERIYMQDENLISWRKTFGGTKQHGSILGRVKNKLINHDRVTVLRKNSPTTKMCECGRKNTHSLKERTYSCACGYTLDRDIHAARNMVRLSIPVERRESTLVENESDWLALSAKQRRSLKQEASSSLD